MWKEVQRILFEDWDPILVNEITNLRDEYDNLVSPIVNMLRSGASVEELTQFLKRAEEELGTFTNEATRASVAEKLRALA
jgi:hypothetical protein